MVISMASPRLMYPWVAGLGIRMIRVARVMSAVISAASVMLRTVTWAISAAYPCQW